MSEGLQAEGCLESLLVGFFKIIENCISLFRAIYCFVKDLLFKNTNLLK